MQTTSSSYRTLAIGRISPWLVSTLAVLATTGALSTRAEDAAKTPATAAAPAAKDLMDMDLDSLANVKVTSVSKKSEKATDAPAAIFVVTQDDIHRTGAQRIVDALRLVPGLDIAQIDAANTAVSARGFNNQYANKLLVLVDGRSVYSPTFSGTYWDQIDTVIDDVERIEVIRGPGATVWGANAVNGVINIMTKSAKDTQGGLVAVGTGTDTRADAAARYGSKISESTYGRVYASYVDRYNLKLSNPVPGYGYNAHDDWDMIHGGFRIDTEIDKEATAMFSGDVFGGTEHAFSAVAAASPTNAAGYLNIPTIESDRVFGANFLGKFERKLSDTTEYSVQAFYDRSERETRGFSDVIQTFDVDGQLSFSLGERNSFVSGVGYRLVDADFSNNSEFAFTPAKANYQLFNAFIQDEIDIVKDRLKLTLGSKLEHNDFTGIEVQPSARLALKITENQTVWGSVSRAVRTPSLVDNGLNLTVQNIPGAVPGKAQIDYTSGSVNSEQLVAYEIGYRIQPTKKILVDVATFYNVYDGLTSTKSSTAFIPTPYFHFINTSTEFNGLNGETYGAELAVTYQVVEKWRMHLNYTYTDVQMHKRTAITVDELTNESSAPENQLSFRNSIDLPHDIQLDGTLRYVDTWSTGATVIPSYVTTDARIGWKATPHLEFAIVGRNLFGSRHIESPTSLTIGPKDIARSVFGKITYSF
jgi:iron complex outermembrane receptor protein